MMMPSLINVPDTLRTTKKPAKSAKDILASLTTFSSQHNNSSNNSNSSQRSVINNNSESSSREKDPWFSSDEETIIDTEEIVKDDVIESCDSDTTFDEFEDQRHLALDSDNDESSSLPIIVVSKEKDTLIETLSTQLAAKNNTACVHSKMLLSGKTTTNEGTLPEKKKRRVEKCYYVESEHDKSFTYLCYPRLSPRPLNSSSNYVNFYLNNTSNFICRNVYQFLYDYQVTGIEFMHRAYCKNTGAILGDDMGVGKTIQVIGLLCAICHKTGTPKDSFNWTQRKNNRMTSNSFTNHTSDSPGPVLIILPANLVGNWAEELEKWMKFDTMILDARTCIAQRDLMIDNIKRGLVEVVLTSYAMLKRYISELSSLSYSVVIFDEMHRLKNPKSSVTNAAKEISCRRKIGLTGTLMQNNHKELFCLMDTIIPSCLGTASHFETYFERVIKKARCKTASKIEIYQSLEREQELQTLMGSYYLRRLKSVNPLLRKIEKNEHVVFCPLTALQTAAYTRVLEMADYQRHIMTNFTDEKDCFMYEYYYNQNGGSSNSYSKNLTVFACITQLMKLSNHLDLIKVDKTLAEGDTKEYQKKFASIAFGNSNSIYKASTLDEFVNTEFSGKMKVLYKLLKRFDKRREKVLIFSKSTRMLTILEYFLKSLGKAYSRLDGQTSDRQLLVNRFNQSVTTLVFLISTMAGGVGLNITSATNVVIFDPSWNPAHDKQAQDRAFRIGQTSDVCVYRLVSAGTIEEMIYVRQIYKTQLTDATTASVQGPRYFNAIQGEDNGELFGISNLFQFEPEGILKRIKKEYYDDGMVIVPSEASETVGGIVTLEEENIVENTQEDDDEEENVIPEENGMTERTTVTSSSSSLHLQLTQSSNNTEEKRTDDVASNEILLREEKSTKIYLPKYLKTRVKN